jgi:tetratricopeptide (TPR) repeat protein
MVLPQWPVSLVAADPAAKIGSDFGDLMEETWAACCLGWARSDYGYPIPYLDRAWALLPPKAGNSVQAVIVEHRKHLLELVRNAEYSLPDQQAAVEHDPFNWELHYWLAFTIKSAGRNEDALNEYLAVSQTPGCPDDCLNDIGWCYCRKGMYEVALGCFERAKTEDEGYSIHPYSRRMMTLQNRILIYCQLGLRKQAEEIASEYVHRHGRIGLPERRALAKLGIDADEIYLRLHPFRA